MSSISCLSRLVYSRKLTTEPTLKKVRHTCPALVSVTNLVLGITGQVLLEGKDITRGNWSHQVGLSGQAMQVRCSNDNIERIDR